MNSLNRNPPDPIPVPNPPADPAPAEIPIPGGTPEGTDSTIDHDRADPLPVNHYPENPGQRSSREEIPDANQSPPPLD